MTDIELALDDDGYLDRQCPSCERYFRWHYGPIEGAAPGEPDPDSYFCPYCGFRAAIDQWWTTEQAEAIQQAALGVVLTEVQRSLSDASRSSKDVKFQVGDVPPPPPGPVPLDDVDELLAVASPCHPYEPVKISDSWAQPVHCLVCSAQFALPK